MADEMSMQAGMDITDDDKLWAALAWLPLIWPIVAIIVMVMEDKKNRPFIKYNAVLSLLTGLVGWILSSVCIGVVVLLAMFYFAWQAYQGQMVNVPLLTNLAKKQGWV
ncbi:MAG: DUF4870 domain-containing protein [Chloroflexi bacterium]|nr:DUF4870 domain-containing protein [Chloroflexota bacterium]MCI0579014.1 DUF4870 domain-containing protein [Chloroflexota bacterium]MCI0644801.1 DUF4870 domain-containing protein [Chloroflexota bacterium]MCI0731976.1 DUF4870 domain-containing protein [Chloroflexota bacterium]